MISKYLSLFSTLNTSIRNGISAPHKAIMLLTIIDMVENGSISDNCIVFSEKLERSFLNNWKRYIGESSIFQPKAGTPFWHLNSEPFWTLVPNEGGPDTISKLQQGNPYSAGTIRQHIRYAQIDNELFEVLNDQTNRARLRVLLISIYLMQLLQKL